VCVLLLECFVSSQDREFHFSYPNKKAVYLQYKDDCKTLGVSFTCLRYFQQLWKDSLGEYKLYKYTRFAKVCIEYIDSAPIKITV
jgi:hypothetical protein